MNKDSCYILQADYVLVLFLKQRHWASIPFRIFCNTMVAYTRDNLFWRNFVYFIRFAQVMRCIILFTFSIIFHLVLG